MKRPIASAALLVVCTLLAGACQVVGVGSPPHYDIQAEMPSAVGLYPGSFVEELGIHIGTVAGVTNRGDHVVVTMKIDKSHPLAAGAQAILVSSSVLGERYIQFEPAYTGGPTMPAGTLLPQSRVTVPVETDTVLRSLNTVLNGINPVDVKQFTTNLAAVLRGQGEKLNQLIGNAAGTLNLLASKSQDLGQLTTTLAQLSQQLGTRDRALAALITDYDLLSQTLASDRSQLDGVITQLTNLTTQGTALLAPNLQPIQTDVADLTTVGQTLDRNLSALDGALAYAPRLFGAAKNAYDPQHNWLPLNPQNTPGPTSAVLAGELRDALASVCRRLAARQPSLATALATCGDPNSSFFNPIINQIPGIIGQLSGTSVPTAASANKPAATPASVFAAGLASIPAVSPAQIQAVMDAPVPASGTSASGTPASDTAAADAATLAESPMGTGPIAAPAPHRHHHGFFAWLEDLL